MALRIWHFHIVRRDNLVVVGHAGICPEVHYASSWLCGEEQLLRGIVRDRDWRAMLSDLALGWAGGVVSSDSPVAQILLPGQLNDEHQLHVQGRMPLEDLDRVVEDCLDKYLQAQPR